MMLVTILVLVHVVHHVRPHALVTVLKVAVTHVVLDALVVVMPDVITFVIRAVAAVQICHAALHVLETAL